MRFDTRYTENPVELVGSSSGVSNVLDISRGGVSLAHDNSLKVGDVVPVHIKYGDIDINTDVKVVSANDMRAGAEFINLDAATKNKLLFLSLILDGEQQQMATSGTERLEASYGNVITTLDQDY